jgi:integrase
MASIQKRGPRKDGSYSYQLQWRDRDTGHQERWTHETEAKAEEWKRLIEANGNSLARAERVVEDSAMSGPTVAEAMESHIRQLTGVTEYTEKRYHDAVRLHFSGELGQRKVKSIEQDDVVVWVKWMEKRGKSPKTISVQHGLLSAAMETAVRRRIIDRNPCRGVKLPKAVHIAEDDIDMTMEDFHAIKAKIDPHFRPFMDFLLGAGCRFSEATALSARDFHLDDEVPIVRITKAHKLRADGGRYVGPPKTQRSRRRVSLAPSTVEAVRPLVEAAGDGFVFLMKDGGDFTHQAFYNRAWRKARKDAGVNDGGAKHVKVHSIRHLHAAILLAHGMDMYKLSARMGHASIQMTVDLYGSLMPDAHFEGAQVAAKALGSMPLPVEAPPEIADVEILEGD